MSSDEHDVVSFPFAFDDRFRPLLAVIGVTPERAEVTVSADHLRARFGPWSLETDLANVVGTCITTDYRWYTAIGARGSFVDRGLTFGTNTRKGVCVRFGRPVQGLDPLGMIRHPGATFTLEDPEGLASLVADRIGAPGPEA